MPAKTKRPRKPAIRKPKQPQDQNATASGLQENAAADPADPNLPAVVSTQDHQTASKPAPLVKPKNGKNNSPTIRPAGYHGKNGGPPIELGEIVRLRLHHKLTYEDIAQRFGVTRQTIFNRMKHLKTLLGDPEQTETYRNNRAEIMDQIESVLTTQLADRQKLKAASINNVAYALQQVNNIGRLERGLSTQNIAVVAGLAQEDRDFIAQMCEQYWQRRSDNVGKQEPEEG